MHRNEALKLIEADMKQFSYKEVGFLTDCRTYLNVTVKSPSGKFYRYIYDELSRKIRKYDLGIELSTEKFIGMVESEVKKDG